MISSLIRTAATQFPRYAPAVMQQVSACALTEIVRKNLSHYSQNRVGATNLPARVALNPASVRGLHCGKNLGVFTPLERYSHNEVVECLQSDLENHSSIKAQPKLIYEFIELFNQFGCAPSIAEEGKIIKKAQEKLSDHPNDKKLSTTIFYVAEKLRVRKKRIMKKRSQVVAI